MDPNPEHVDGNDPNADPSAEIEIPDSQITQIDSGEADEEALDADQIIEGLRICRADTRATLQGSLTVSALLLPLLLGSLYLVVGGDLKTYFSWVFALLLFVGILTNIWSIICSINGFIDTSTPTDSILKRDYITTLDSVHQTELAIAKDAKRYLLVTIALVSASLIIFGIECMFTNVMDLNNDTEPQVHIVFENSPQGNISVVPPEAVGMHPISIPASTSLVKQPHVPMTRQTTNVTPLKQS